MTKERALNTSLQPILTHLCEEALVEETESDPAIRFFTRAPDGKTIAEESTTISINRKACDLLQEAITQLYNNSTWSVELSKKELEQEVVTAVFEGTLAMQEDVFCVEKTIESLFNRLNEGSSNWDIYLPILGLELPSGHHLSLAGGTLKCLKKEEEDALKTEYSRIWNQAKFKDPEKRDTGIASLSQQLDETIDSSNLWYYIQVNGRTQAAKNQAIEAAVLATDILRFFAIFTGTDPEIFALRFPTQTASGIMHHLQIAQNKVCEIHSESGMLFDYKLDLSKYEKLTSLSEFQIIQGISNKPNPNETEQKLLLGVQQYAEATRIRSLGLRLVWYLSALEAFLTKESEGSLNKKVEMRIGKLLSHSAEQRINPLYDKRRRLVHYGHRNRIGNELITKIEVRDAKKLAYLGIISAINKIGSFENHDEFLDSIDNL